MRIWGGKIMNLLITHTDLDGVGCAILAKYFYGDNIKIIYANYNDVNNIMAELDSSKYEKIFMTDLSCHLDYISKIDKLLDYHKSALYLNKYDNCEVKITHNTGALASGTSMFADFLEEEFTYFIPQWLDYVVNLIRLYDTWEWKAEGIEQANNLNTLFYVLGRERFIEHILDSKHKLFDEVDMLLINCENDRKKAYIKEKKNDVYASYFKGIKFCVLFAEQYTSVLADELKDEYDVIVIISDMKGTMSFRSKEYDVSKLAKLFGGGGHKNAAGANSGEVSLQAYHIVDLITEKIRSDLSEELQD